MTKKVFTLPPDKPTKAALDLMKEYDIGAVVLTERGKIAGIVTERDILKKITGNSAENLQEPVSQIASKNVITGSPKTQVWEAFATMLRNKIRRLPVVDEERLVGIVTERDLFKWTVKVAYEPNIPEDLKRLLI